MRAHARLCRAGWQLRPLRRSAQRKAGPDHNGAQQKRARARNAYWVTAHMRVRRCQALGKP